MLYVTGAKQRTRRLDEWNRFERAYIVAVNPDTGRQELCVDYVSPPELSPDIDPSILFKAASLAGNRLYACTNTEVLIYEVPEFRQIGLISQPSFNDLHHVLPLENGNIVVVVTGLDMVVELTADGCPVREWGAVDQDPWARFDRTKDYRKVPTTKPHASHPNYAFLLDGELWITRFQQQDAISLNHPDRRIFLGHSPHDGVSLDGKLYFTSIDGFVFVVDEKTLKIEDTIDLNVVDDKNPPLGWCRSILPLGDGRCWVGFTKIRPTSIKENIAWIGKRIANQGLSTRMVLYDLNKRKKLREINLEGTGLSCVFSIVPFPE